MPFDSKTVLKTLYNETTSIETETNAPSTCLCCSNSAPNKVCKNISGLALSNQTGLRFNKRVNLLLALSPS